MTPDDLERNCGKSADPHQVLLGKLGCQLMAALARQGFGVSD